MKDTNSDYTAIWKIIGVFALLMIVIFFACCKSTKSQGYTKEVYDSLYVAELEEKIKTLEIENGELRARVNELEFLGVQFNPNCDSILKNALLKAGCNVDSINAILSQYKSRIKIFSDGSLEAEGFIKSLKRTKEKNEEIISKYKKEIDSLKELKQKEITNTVKETITVTKTKKNNLFWIGFIVGCICIIALSIGVSYYLNKRR